MLPAFIACSHKNTEHVFYFLTKHIIAFERPGREENQMPEDHTNNLGSRHSGQTDMYLFAGLRKLLDPKRRSTSVRDFSYSPSIRCDCLPIATASLENGLPIYEDLSKDLSIWNLFSDSLSTSKPPQDNDLAVRKMNIMISNLPGIHGPPLPLMVFLVRKSNTNCDRMKLHLPLAHIRLIQKGLCFALWHWARWLCTCVLQPLLHPA